MTIPYFYIIEHVPTGKYYAGVRWAHGCNPSELLTENGYCTSSEIVKGIIEHEGLSAFIIRKTKIFEDAEKLRLYEHKFLKKVNAASNARFYNLHNSEKPSFGTPEFDMAMLKTYGVKHSMHNPKSKQRMKATTKKKYGGVGFQNSYAKKAAEAALIKEHGSLANAGRVARANAALVIKQKYNVDNPAQHPKIKEKIRKTFQKIGHAQGEKNSQYGTKWITDGVIEKKIPKDKLSHYLELGWKPGRKKASI